MHIHWKRSIFWAKSCSVICLEDNSPFMVYLVYISPRYFPQPNHFQIVNDNKIIMLCYIRWLLFFFFSFFIGHICVWFALRGFFGLNFLHDRNFHWFLVINKNLMTWKFLYQNYIVQKILRWSLHFLRMWILARKMYVIWHSRAIFILTLL